MLIDNYSLLSMLNGFDISRLFNSLGTLYSWCRFIIKMTILYCIYRFFPVNYTTKTPIGKQYCKVKEYLNLVVEIEQNAGKVLTNYPGYHCGTLKFQNNPR